MRTSCRALPAHHDPSPPPGSPPTCDLERRWRPRRRARRASRGEGEQGDAHDDRDRGEQVAVDRRDRPTQGLVEPPDSLKMLPAEQAGIVSRPKAFRRCWGSSQPRAARRPPAGRWRLLDGYPLIVLGKPGPATQAAGPGDHDHAWLRSRPAWWSVRSGSPPAPARPAGRLAWPVWRPGMRIRGRGGPGRRRPGAVPDQGAGDRRAPPSPATGSWRAGAAVGVHRRGLRPPGPAHLVGELGRPVGLHLSEKRWPIPTKGRRPALVGRCRQ